jgi:hypothetical protein
MSNVPQDCAPTPTPADKAESLYQNYLAGGPDAAYASLKKDYDASSGMCNRDQYFQTVAADLQASGHMPNIAVGWLKAEKDQLGAGHEGVINKQDVIRAEANGGLDAIFGKVVLTSVPSPGDNKTFFDQIAHTKKAWTDSPDGIEDADLRKYTRQMHRAERHEYNLDETAKAAAPLFDNNAELLKALDTGPNGERNGFISRREMKNFLKEYKNHPGEGAYTAENAEYVNEVLHGEIGRISNHPFHGFSVARTERRAGMTAGDVEEQPTPVNNNLATDMPGAPTADKANGAVPADKSNCAVPTAPVEKTPPPKPANNPDVCVDLEIHKQIDALCRVRPGEGYDAVAARLLNIGADPHQRRTHQDVQDIETLGRQIKVLNGEYSTFHLRTGVVLPVSANIETLTAENPRLKTVLDNMKNSFVQSPAKTAQRDQAEQENQY